MGIVIFTQSTGFNFTQYTGNLLSKGFAKAQIFVNEATNDYTFYFGNDFRLFDFTIWSQVLGSVAFEIIPQVTPSSFVFHHPLFVSHEVLDSKNLVQLSCSSLADSSLIFPQFIQTQMSRDIVISQSVITALSDMVRLSQFVVSGIRETALYPFSQVISNSIISSQKLMTQVLRTDINDGFRMPQHVTSALADSDLVVNQLIPNWLRHFQSNITQIIPSRISTGWQFIQHFNNIIQRDPIYVNQSLVVELMEKYFLQFAQYINTNVDPQAGPGVAETTGYTSLWYDPPLPGGPLYGYPTSPQISLIYPDVLIDGVSYIGMIESVEITCRESDILDQVDITFKDPSAFSSCDPQIRIGQLRVEVRVGSDLSNPDKHESFRFYIEEITANEEGHWFSIWGRSRAALLTEPFNEEIENSYTDMLSSAIASDLAGSIPIDWQLEDFFHSEFNVEGYPLEGIQQLVETLGGVLRSKPDGSLVARKKYPIRPRYLIDATVAAADGVEVSTPYQLTRYLNIVSSDYSEEQAQYTEVEVRGGDPADSYSLEIEIEGSEDGCYLVGQSAYVRIYHTDTFKYDREEGWDDLSEETKLYYICVNGGSLVVDELQKVEEYTSEEEDYTGEIIEIINGSGSLSKRCHQLLSYEWVSPPKIEGCSVASVDDLIVSVKESDVSVKIPTGDEDVVLIGMLRVRYNILYDRFIVTSGLIDPLSATPDEKSVMLAVVTDDKESSGVYVKYVVDTAAYVKPAPVIQDDTLTSVAMANVRAEAYLDDTYYQKRKWNLKIPFYLDKGLRDGYLVWGEDDYWDVQGHGYIRSADISIEIEDAGVIKVWQTLEFHQYRRTI